METINERAVEILNPTHYDDTFDITIHCESQKEQDEAMAMLRKANSSAGEVMSPENMAHSLMALCKAHSDAGNGCPGCPFDKPTSNNGDGECRLGVPDSWDF